MAAAVTPFAFRELADDGQAVSARSDSACSSSATACGDCACLQEHAPAGDMHAALGKLLKSAATQRHLVAPPLPVHDFTKITASLSLLERVYLFGSQAVAQTLGVTVAALEAHVATALALDNPAAPTCAAAPTARWVSGADMHRGFYARQHAKMACVEAALQRAYRDGGSGALQRAYATTLVELVFTCCAFAGAGTVVALRTCKRRLAAWRQCVDTHELAWTTLQCLDTLARGVWATRGKLWPEHLVMQWIRAEFARLADAVIRQGAPTCRALRAHCGISDDDVEATVPVEKCLATERSDVPPA